MLILNKSIYWRILFGFVAVIIFAVTTSGWIEYHLITTELPKLLTKIKSEDIAVLIEKTYGETDEWNREDISRAVINTTQTVYGSENATIHIVVKDNQNKTIFNSFLGISNPGSVPLVMGNSTEIRNSKTGNPIGSVTLYISSVYLEKETDGYLLHMLPPRILFGLLTLAMGIGIAALLSRRISAPVVALTKAARKISEQDVDSLLPVSSTDELRQMSASFNEMIRILQTQKKLRQRLIGDVSHELNTPLNLIRFESRGIIDRLKSPNKAAIQIIHEVDALRNLVNDLSWLAETDSGMIQMNIEYCQYEILLQEELDRWKLEAESAQIRLSVVPTGEDMPPVKLDSHRIQQVLDNLVSNSIKNTPAEGEITIECKKTGNLILTSVSDNGTGIQDEDIPFVFERFYRADESRHRDTGGTGLGLAIAKKIVELHHGTIHVRNNPGRGCTFSFTLPLPEK